MHQVRDEPVHDQRPRRPQYVAIHSNLRRGRPQAMGRHNGSSCAIDGAEGLTADAILRRALQMLGERPRPSVTLLQHRQQSRILQCESEDSAMKCAIVRFVRDDTAATAIEYAIIAGFLSIAIVVAVQNIGTSLNGTFTSIATGLK